MASIADGDYQCKVRRGDREFITIRRCIRGHWFGGCRPFSETDIVIAYRKCEGDPWINL